MTDKPAWYGGNKIPDSYLKKFIPSQKSDNEVPYELRVFLNQLGADQTHKVVR